MPRQDYFLDSNYDLVIQDGDFLQGDCSDIHASLILGNNKGDFRQYPLIGVGLNRFLGSSASSEVIESFIKDELQKDDLTVVEIDVERTDKSFNINLKVQ